MIKNSPAGERAAAGNEEQERGDDRPETYLKD